MDCVNMLAANVSCTRAWLISLISFGLIDLTSEIFRRGCGV